MGAEEARYFRRINGAGNGTQRQTQAVAQQAPAAPDDHRAHGQAHHRVEPEPTGEPHGQRAQHDGGGDRGIGRHMQISATDIEVALAAGKQPGSQAIHQDANAGHGYHHHLGHRLRMGKPAHCLPCHPTHGNKQEQGIEKRGQDGARAQPIGKAGRGWPARQHHRHPGNNQAQNIRQVVASIRQQRHGIGQHAKAGLDQHKGQIQPDTPGEGATMAVGRRMLVVVMVMGHGCGEDLGSPVADTRAIG